MPSSIGSVGQLVAVIRSQLANRVDTSSPRQMAAPKAQRASTTASAQTLEATIGRRVSHIDRDDPKRGKKAFRVFLESILLSNFGEHLINDPKFYQLVDDVQESMEADPEIRAMIDKAIVHLIAQK